MRQSVVRYAVALLCVAVLRVDQLPAEEYRGEIASIDRLLFRTTPLTGNDAGDLATEWPAPHPPFGHLLPASGEKDDEEKNLVAHAGYKNPSPREAGRGWP